ncbi:hypothetical protein L596_025802 [Steinernema carpocapsae]|nr:hypothetical protein L596_025802 [Steinernema carpocapsae]
MLVPRVSECTGIVFCEAPFDFMQALAQEPSEAADTVLKTTAKLMKDLFQEFESMTPGTKITCDSQDNCPVGQMCFGRTCVTERELRRDFGNVAVETIEKLGGLLRQLKSRITGNSPSSEDTGTTKECLVEMYDA